ncbi:MAG: molybdopterin-dependent oxidoreductase [Deltaproteobacteria bacterium]|nr:MAG: molybdopterin-dependent oxidoreductase [Deltaproteobacteria bacterium]
MSSKGFTRREFLRGTGVSIAALSLSRLTFLTSGGRAYGAEAGPEVMKGYEYREWEEIYREKWQWDKITKGTHLVDCYPGSCSWNVYAKDGVVWREEQAANYPVVDPRAPDWNPRGCQKGCSYSNQMYNPERLKYPIRRVGNRGEGKWKRISWDEALTEIADKALDAIKEAGPESIIYEPGPGQGGYIHWIGYHLPWMLLGATNLDLDATIGDFNRGVYESFGKFQFMDSVDGWFWGDLHIIWHMNPVYTRIPSYHFISEARYNGATVVTVAPDYSPSAIHADEWIPVNYGSDAALCLAVAKILVDEKLYKADFIKEQTDLAFLVRKDTKRFLRESDLKKDGKEDQFYFFDAKANSIVKAPRGTLKLPCDPALEGEYRVKLGDGKEVTVEPAFGLLKRTLAVYTPEAASGMCGTNPDTIRRFARMIAKAKGVQLLLGWDACKYYHGDLIERAMCLVLALTGNWGKKGAGIRGWCTEAMFTGVLTAMSSILSRQTTFSESARFTARGMLTLAKIRAEDPDMTEEVAAITMMKRMGRRMGWVPPTFYWYFHAGFKETWNNRAWHDPSMKRTFDEYIHEGIKKGWYEGIDRPAPDQIPQIYIIYATSPLRKTRGGMKHLLNNIWPKFKLIVDCNTRLSTTSLYSDIVLPAAGFYEKTDTRFPTPHVPFLTLTDKAVEPPGEAKDEFEISRLLAKKIEERALAKGFTKYKNRAGREYDLTNFSAYTEVFKTDDEFMEEALKGSVDLGELPKGTDLKKMREVGFVRQSQPRAHLNPFSLGLATDTRPDEPIVPLVWHVGDKKIPYPTLTGRVQFYIDHEWFIEAGEELPVHKDNPKIGGNGQFRLTSGHLRWSVHSIWVTNELMLRLHQGRPFMFMNPEAAKQKGIKDGDLVRVFNDFESFNINVKLTPSVRPDQVICYHAWEPYQHKGWKSYDIALPGMIKWLDIAGGYGHLNFWVFNWCTNPVDRGIAVDVVKA